MTTNFSAAVSDWVKESQQRLEAVFKESSQRVIEVAQTPVGAGGRMRVDTGFLRASGVASLDGLPPATRPKPASGSFNYDVSTVSLVIAGAKIGDTIYFGWTANYALPREYGARGQEPDAFMRTAAQRWQSIVEQVCTELRARVSGPQGSSGPSSGD